jgi:uncharacterized glyoxalase superfamily protein PhnB
MGHLTNRQVQVGVIDFLGEAFGARQPRRFDLPDGTIMHADVHIDDTVVMIADGGGPFRSGATPLLGKR